MTAAYAPEAYVFGSPENHDLLEAESNELLHFGHEKVCRLFAELDAADLIVRRRQGQGKANRIYLKEFTQKSDFRNSRSPGIGRK